MAEDVKKGCECCNHEIESEDFDSDNIMMLEDESGQEVPYHFITALDYEDKHYIYLQSAVEGEEDFVEIYELEEVSEGEEEFERLVPVDDELYNKLYEILVEQYGSDDGECVCDCDEENCDCEHKDEDCDKDSSSCDKHCGCKK